jgi:hypothetical protein
MGTRRQIRRGVEQVLRALGNDLDTIVSSLEAHGVRGMPKDPEECALARYLNAVIGGDPAISAVRVWQHSVRVHLRSCLGRSVVVQLPEILSQFIVAFDVLGFPQLVAGGEDGHGDVGNPSAGALDWNRSSPGDQAP